MSKEVVGAILAAGRGSRMTPLSDRWPKPLLPICNKPMVQYQIEGLRATGVRKVFVVVGHLREAFARDLPVFDDIEVEYIAQESQLGIAHAVLQIEPLITSPFILLLGDIYFVPSEFGSMIRIFHESGATAVLAAKYEEDTEMIRRNFAIVHGDGLVKRVIEKPQHVPNQLKGCGAYLFDVGVFDAIRRTPRTAMRDEYEITDSIQIHIDDGNEVRFWPEILYDMNITDPRDLLICNLLELRRRKTDYVIADSASVPDGATIENAVIGPDVVIEGKPTIRNSVVLAGSRIQGDNRLEHRVVASGHVLTYSDIVIPDSVL